MRKHWIKAAKLNVLVIVLLLTLSFATAKSTFGTGVDEPLPNVTQLEIYDVTDLSASQKETEGTLVDSGINKTFRIDQEQDWRQYRFSFKIRNDGDSVWDINGSDQLYHDGLNSGWTVDKIWYNISSDHDTGTFSGGKVDWNTSKGGTLSSGETMYAKYLVNISLSSSEFHHQEFLVNDTSNSSGSKDEHELDVNKLGFLNLTLEDPVNDTTVTQNKTFLINASVKCIGGECGEVNVTPRYNESNAADTLIPENSGSPFHTTGSQKKTCSQSLDKDQKCYVSWDVNATGTAENYHLVDTNASSSFNSVSNNDTSDNWVQINTLVMLNLSWNTTNFGVLDPGVQDKPAQGNSNLSYNVTVPNESNRADVWTRATSLDSDKSDNYSIGAGNLSYSLQNDSSSENIFSTSYQLLKSDVAPETTFNTFYWLDVPTGIIEGGYTGSIYVKANLTG